MKNKKITVLIIVLLGAIVIHPMFLKRATPPSLSMTDLEHIDISKLTIQDYPDTTSVRLIIDSAVETKGTIYLDMGIYSDLDSTTQSDTWLIITGKDAPDIRSGDVLTLMYDGGKILDVYLPSYNVQQTLNLYISDLGETYYDSTMTDAAAACTIGNGCMGFGYTQFTLSKDSFLEGGSFDSFISNANMWL